MAFAYGVDTGVAERKTIDEEELMKLMMWLTVGERNSG
jgi:hypothetical protein